MSPAAIRAALFDLDGLAVDSEPLHVEAWRRAMEEAGAGWDPEWIDPYFGTPVSNTAAGLARDHGLTSEAVQALRDRHFAQLTERGIRPRPGLAEAVAMLRKAGLSLGVVTSGTRSYVERALRGLDGVRFDAVVAKEDVTHPKPHAEPYLAGARLLGAEPAGCVALEDAPAGIASARAAGMLVVAVPNEHTVAMDFSEASHVAPDLTAAARWILERDAAAGDQ
ncbi:MAG: HAD family hydrolase [Actinomycetota bacterium]